MRRLIVSTILCCTLLWACAASGSNDKGKQSSLSGVSTGSSVTNRAVTVSGEVIIHETEPAADHSGSAQKDDVKRAEVQTITDETGKKRKLKLGNINLENKEILIQRHGGFEGYTQVADGHYYYLRKVGDNCYVLYCDRGDIVGSFHLEEGYYFQGFCKYDSRFYVILYHPDSAEKDWGFGNSLLAVVDFSTGNLRILRKINNVTYYDPYFYKDKIKLYENYDEDYDVSEDVDDENDGKEDTYQYDLIGDEEPDHSREEYSEYDYTVDGYRYYAKTGKEVCIFRQNLKSQREEEIFRYQTKHPGKTQYVSLAMDEEDMFICEEVQIKEESGLLHDKYLLYTVPRWGGKMKLVTDAMDQGMDYVYNSKYIFWTDQLNQVYRWNRRTQKEEKVIKTKMYSAYLVLSCTEEGLYLQKANLRNIQLYYMEADGDEFRRIQFARNYAEEYYEGEWYEEDYGFR